MFGKKKEPRRPRPAGDLEQFGIFEVPDINMDNMMDDNDEDLEAELAALTAGNDTGYKSRRSIARKAVADVNLDEMIAESMKDTVSDEEPEGDDDPALLKELQILTGNKDITEEPETPEMTEEEQAEPTNESESTPEENNSMQDMIKMLQERLTIYEKAEQKARKENESSRAKRFNRGVRTIKEMLVSLQAGRNIDEADIPPLLPPSATGESTIKNTVNEISPTEVNESSATSDMVLNDGPSEPSEPMADVTVDQEALNKLKAQQQKYKIAAVAWKKAGNKEQALEYVKTVKQFDIVIAAVAAGEKLDLSDMPPTPTLPSSANIVPSAQEKEENEIQQQASTDTGCLT